MNSVRATTLSSVYLAMRHIFPEVPISAGAFEPLRVTGIEGTFLDAHYPRPVSGCAAEVSQRIAEAVFAALVPALPDRVTAAPAGTSGNFALGGHDPESGRATTSCTRSPAAATAATPTTTGSRTAARRSASPRRRRSRSWSSSTRSSTAATRCTKAPAAPAAHRGGFGLDYEVELLRGDRPRQLRHGPRPLRPAGRARRRGRRRQPRRDNPRRRDPGARAPLQGAGHPARPRRPRSGPHPRRRRLRRPARPRPRRRRRGRPPRPHTSPKDAARLYPGT